ncbi:hypothetical protein IQ249_13080 [Lusitaniella coriacea LEGE 07157]|uniref:Uncharacterized protein n=1 Tax=Lusitaniella coriacea LEGE 07157 TaxID=945747 RepID=A0A8J7DZY6_9CYAN|nr:hypothetical protein [Lusitaniella coriacea]MBE9116834.1 hypothetical protein [Lusitaniella coriacea LEGE 07157]
MSVDAIQNNETEDSKATSEKGGLVPASQPAGLDLYQTPRLPQNRPIEQSHLKVDHMIFGNRPVMKSEMDVSNSIVISGNRPIAKSHLAVSETYTVMGNRPVASNEIEDINTLIGYLD